MKVSRLEKMVEESKWRKHSNLQRFLCRTTPSVEVRNLPMPVADVGVTDWHCEAKDHSQYFDLADLWDSYVEWSVYGLGIPVVLNNGEAVVQYYVPYLSAIQIFTAKFHPVLRNITEDSETDSWSDDSESEKISRSWDGISEDSSVDQDCLWPNKDRLGHLYMQYVERSPPYSRIPLADKVNELARDYPGLSSFRSTDISPASWMSIAWYPIYHIPTRRNMKDLSASFLTYHTISSAFQDDAPEILENNISCSDSWKERKEFTDSISCISLPPFGLATYKMNQSIWVNPETSDHEMIMTLYNAADSWLKQLRVQHHDFNYFSTHFM